METSRYITQGGIAQSINLTWVATLTSACFRWGCLLPWVDTDRCQDSGHTQLTTENSQLHLLRTTQNYICLCIQATGFDGELKVNRTLHKVVALPCFFRRGLNDMERIDLRLNPNRIWILARLHSLFWPSLKQSVPLHQRCRYMESLQMASNSTLQD